MTAQPTNTPADDAPYWDAALETQTRADWDALKLELLKAHLQHAYNGSPYYRASFDAAGVHPGQVSSLDDLRRFPFIDKHALRDRQIAIPPLGDLVAELDELALHAPVPPGRIVRRDTDHELADRGCRGPHNLVVARDPPGRAPAPEPTGTASASISRR